jgi:hypothetical protein
MASGPSGFKLASRSLWLWAGALLLLVGIVFTTTGIQEVRQEQDYQAQGLTVQATVSDKSIERAKRGENSRTRYVITYRFTTAQGEEADGSAEVSVEEWERLEAGHSFPVTYLADVPQSSRASGKDDWITALVMTGLGGILALLGGGLTFGSLRTILRTLRLSREGLAAEGTILHVGPTNTTINRVPQWRIRYRYRDHFGRTQEGQSHLLSPEEASGWREGDTGTVRFDRQRPEVSMLGGKT